ncbi:medium-chain fatty acid-CoA ligase faa2 [Coemansia asiatica]|uniref:Medium-chain fatty acid-CoA ligase faa2 n=1 Tax=Coemansia asiatica TaxID=1052880 RepID=A0A9W7XR88_9FUNG|nr:medium-chain fatty acid-CoA ligase faa2 [Coemansia asiatica]
MGIALMDMDQVVEIGRVNPASPILPKPSDISTICYTPGTTGAPKGVTITHAAFAYAAHATYLSLQLQERTTYLSCFPLHLIADRHNIYALMFNIVRIGFPSSSSSSSNSKRQDKVFADMQKLHPTIVFMLPQLLRRAYAESIAVTTEAGGLFGILSRIGLSMKIANFRKGNGLRHTLWDHLVFKGIAQRFGGSLETLITGYSRLQPQVHDFFRAALSCNVLNRYCLTELAGGGFMQTCESLETGSVGVPQPGIDICLRSIPSLGYNIADMPCSRGVLLVRSESICSKHLPLTNRDQASNMDGEWLVTGDIAQFNTDGTFTIIDRLSNVVSLSSGDNVALAYLESIYSSHPMIDTVIVYAEENEHERELVAVAMPKHDKFVAWARSIVPEGSSSDMTDLCSNKLVAAAMVEELNSVARKADTRQTHWIGAVYLEPSISDQINSSSGVFTETFSIRRRSVAQHYLPAMNSQRKLLDSDDTVTISLSCASDTTCIGNRAKKVTAKG